MFDPNDENYKRAKKRVNEIRDFYTHISIYFAVMFFLFMIDLLTGSGWWFYWAALAWGLGVVIHGATTLPGFNSSEWEERKIRQLMAQEGLKPKNELPADDAYFDRTSDV